MFDFPLPENVGPITEARIAYSTYDLDPARLVELLRTDEWTITSWDLGGGYEVLLRIADTEDVACPGHTLVDHLCGHAHRGSFEWPVRVEVRDGLGEWLEVEVPTHASDDR
jgi:hypothetical protein